MSVRGIDLSNNNGTVDFARVYKAGYRFALIKVTEGDWNDPAAAQYVQDAKAAGLIVGAYCFVSPKQGRSGGQEAELFLKRARQVGLLSKGCLRPVADIEVTRLPVGRPTRRYDYQFLNRVIERTGVKPFIYTGSWFWDGVLGARNPHDCPLWLAAYTPAWRSLIPGGFKHVSIHQYTDKGTVPGVTGHVDLDLYLGRDVRMLKAHHSLKHDH